MENTFQIQEATIIPASVATHVSKPFFYCDEENSTYRATMKAYNAEGEVVQNLEVKFTQEDYDKWGTDNEYIYNLIYTKLGLTRI